MIKDIALIISTLISLSAVCVSAYAVSSSRQSKLTSAYFDKMTHAYERFMESFLAFFYNPCDDTRNEFSAAVHIAVLYSSEDGAKAVQVLFCKAMDYTRAGSNDAKHLEEWVGIVTKLLHEEIQRFENRKRW